ncbi:MAG: hypothetical protein QXW20_07600 [Ignisphaera sp.]
MSNSYIVRRVATCCPGDHAVELLKLLAEKLRDEGKEYLVALGPPNHSNVLYKLHFHFYFFIFFFFLKKEKREKKAFPFFYDRKIYKL